MKNKNHTETLFKKLDSYSLAGVLENLDCHVLITGCTNYDKDLFLEKTKILDSKYFSLIESSKESGWLTPYILNEEKFFHFESELISTKEKNLIIDTTDTKLNIEKTLTPLLKTARKKGKRLIIIAPTPILFNIKSLFGAVITLTNNNKKNCHIELIS